VASIQTGIELNDQFSGVLNNIINSVNLAVASMYDMQQSMNADIDTSSIEGARNEIDQATAAINAMNEALNHQVSPDVVPPTPDTGTPEVINVDVNPVLPDPLVENPDSIPLEVQPNAPPEPVQIPVQWETDGLEVFTSTGIERFQQEVQSANGMLEQLSNTQDAIARQAFNTNILPPDAFQDLNRLATRIDLVRGRIQQLENNPVNIGTDVANAELEQLRGQLSQAIEEQEALNRAVDNMDVPAANAAYLRLSQTVGNTERYIRDNVDEQGRFNREIQEGTQEANALLDTIKGAVAAYVSIQSIGKALDISDELTLTTSRLDMMNDDLQTTQELVNMVYAAAQDARGSFSDMADVVARFGNNAGDAFSSSEEVVAFADLVQKQMTIAGAGTQEAANAMLQLSQALGSGVLRGDELNSIFEQAPNLIQSIADYLDVPIGQIREMASEGELSADIVKAAIFASADEINARFEQMPMTWGQVWQSMQNTALIAFQPVLQRLNQIANSDAFQTFVNGAIEAMATLANVILNIFDLVAMVGGFIADNWSVISPIIYGVIAALAVYAAYLGIVKGMEIASAAATAIMTGAKLLDAAAMVVFTGATWAGATAQMGLNSAMYACPIVWIVVLVIALIAALVALCNWIAQVTGAANSGIGIIVGALSVAAAFIGNLFVALINMVIDIFVVLWNFIAAFVNFFGNVFTDPVGAIARLFFDLVDTILSLLQTLAGAIDAIFGSNLAGAVQGWRDNLGGWVDETFGQGEEIMAKVSGEDWHVDRFEYGEAWDAGVAVGDGIAEAIDNFSLSDIFGSTDIPDPQDYTSGFEDVIASSGMGDNLGDIAGDTGAIKDGLDITEEDLKYLRDIAEQEAVNRFTTAEIKVDMTNNNNINNGMDLDGVVSGLTDAVNEAIETMTEGVHD
jgi:tape measure domain-containing protein